jgi:hypothetical protein
MFDLAGRQENTGLFAPVSARLALQVVAHLSGLISKFGAECFLI